MGTVVRKGQYYSVFMVLSLVTAAIILHDQLASAQNISHFVVEEASFTRLCETKNILTVNRKSPAPTIYAHAGETLIMDVENKGNDNLTIFWREGRYLTRHERQLIWLIQPGRKVRQNITISDQGTLWWHAMNIWQSATVHGAIVVYPMPGISYPFPKPHADIPIILGEWWKKDLKEVILEYIASSSNIMHSDAFTINSQPGDFYPCSNNGTFKIAVETGKTYLLRIVNAAAGKTLVFGIAMHNLTVVAMDGRPINNPFTSDYVELSLQQSLDCISSKFLL
ncbi:PREDICTED: putative laccase-9 [Nicotiana attenuata]|uniref:putative laccase-9 n=1 Tax=Nicotiana attenuata TaxID=49451 RepID=UPI000904F0D8|nr:PREDICTED: putative laccase-9 [Nicotiana attenuata]